MKTKKDATTDNNTDTDKQKEDAEREAKIQAELQEKDRLLAEERERRAKAEGMAEGMKTAAAAKPEPAQRQWTEEEWTAWEEKTGMKREALTTMQTVLGAQSESIKAEMNERIRQAEDKARKAEERYAQFENTRSYENTKRDYLQKRPQFARYEKDFDEFVKDFPDEFKRDPAKLEGLFNKAETYIKGKIGGEMNRNISRNTRYGSNYEPEGEQEEQVDLSDLRSHERLTVEKILPTKEKEDKLKANRHDMKGDAGIMINSRDEWDKYKK